MKMNAKELTDQIYDTLLENAGMDKLHPKLDVNKITCQFCDSSSGEIFLEIGRRMYKIKVTQEPHNLFLQWK